MSFELSLDFKIALVKWFRSNQRPLPWRKSRDPYGIWISEVMLQQTTASAVSPYYEKFLARFPSLNDLAKARLPQVIKFWAGLGYYSRAKNLHLAAQSLAKLPTFPRSHRELLKYPGFGAYTARAVASLAFDEAVGVLDGNVIRVISRFYNWPMEWWKPTKRRELQSAVDNWVCGVSSGEMNQALMELGATICTPRRPTCPLCPLTNICAARKHARMSDLPLQRPKRKREVWLWKMEIHRRPGKIAITKSIHAPFLKQHWVLPGKARQLGRKPKVFDFRHSITHHDIYVQIISKPLRPPGEVKWISSAEIEKWAPASVFKKALARVK